MKARLAASIALSAALLVGTSACTLISVNGTLKPYQPSDGVGATIGDVQVRNMLGLSDDGADVALVFSIINTSSSDETVTIQFTDGDGDKHDVDVDVPSRATVAVGNSADDQLVLRGADVTVGSLIPVYLFVKGDETGKGLQIPVLDGTQLEYSDLLPGPAPKPSPSVGAIAEDAEAE